MANTRIPIFNADAQTAYIDYETDATDGDGRQVIVVGSPSVKAAVAEVASLDVGASSTAYGQVVRLAGSAQANIVAVSSGVTIGVRLGVVEGTLGVRVGQVDGSVAVHLVGTGGTLGVRVGQVDGSIAVHLVGTGGTLGVNVGKIEGTSAIYLHSTAGTFAVNVGKVDGTVAVYLHSTGGTLGVNVGKIEGTSAIHLFSTGGTIGVRVGQIDGSTAVHLVGTGGTLGVRVGQVDGSVFTNAGHTASIFTVSGSTSGVSASGVTLVSPSANYSFKVFAYSIQTTGIISMTPRFTNGAASSPTDFWRPLITAVETTSSPKGANLAVTPPGFLFATGVSTTLALLNDGSLVHYSVSYIKESA